MLRASHLPLWLGFHHLGRISVPRLRALSSSRRQLARLDDHLLDDIGLTREEAAREAARRAWDAPAHWLQ